MMDKRASEVKVRRKAEELLAAWGGRDAQAFLVCEEADGMALSNRA